MKLVIFAGGFGTRLSEETQSIPKPMVKVGNMPIIWHIMKYYSFFGISDFVICGGYKVEEIKDYFSNFYRNSSDLFIDLSNNTAIFSNSQVENWKIRVVDTGYDTLTAGRLSRVREFIDSECFYLTYGDGLSNIDLNALLKSHDNAGKPLTISATRPPQRFGTLSIGADNTVEGFNEKYGKEHAYINGGFFVCDPKILDIIHDDSGMFEEDVLKKLAMSRSLNAFKHDDFWQPMDTVYERNILNQMWLNDQAPWKVW